MDETENPSNTLPVTAPCDIECQAPVDTEQSGSDERLPEVAQPPGALDPSVYVLLLLQTSVEVIRSC